MLLLLVGIVSFILLLIIVNVAKMNFIGIAFSVIAWFAMMFIVGIIEQKIKHKHVDNKNARIKAAGGNKRKLSERYERNEE